MTQNFPYSLFLWNYLLQVLPKFHEAKELHWKFVFLLPLSTITRKNFMSHVTCYCICQNIFCNIHTHLNIFSVRAYFEGIKAEQIGFYISALFLFLLLWLLCCFRASGQHPTPDWALHSYCECSGRESHWPCLCCSGFTPSHLQVCQIKAIIYLQYALHSHCLKLTAYIDRRSSLSENAIFPS